MKLSISNLAWAEEFDEQIYAILKERGFSGLEIAPTRLFGKSPYQRIDDALTYSKILFSKYGLRISSIQSIWYGIDKNIFDSSEERDFLLNYTKKAIEFAEVLGCKNLVFGCPKNRNINSDCQNYLDIAYDFFFKLGEYAKHHNTTIALEANPPCYQTNFINTTEQAFEFCKKIASDGLRVNVDLGTMIYNEEDDRVLSDNLDLINHIHISEPYLKLIKKNRSIHYYIFNLNYNNYYSIEMSKSNSVSEVKDTIIYIDRISHNKKSGEGDLWHAQ